MDLKEIKNIIKLVEVSDIEELEIHEKDFQIRVTKGRPTSADPVFAQSLPPSQVQPASAPEAAEQISPSKPAAQEDSNLIKIHAPMVGTFYRASGPDADPYVKEGDIVQPGRVLCIIEAMKLMNEIESEVSGKVVKILVENAQPVEYNQPLFLVEKA